MKRARGAAGPRTVRGKGGSLRREGNPRFFPSKRGSRRIGALPAALPVSSRSGRLIYPSFSVDCFTSRTPRLGETSIRVRHYNVTWKRSPRRNGGRSPSWRLMRSFRRKGWALEPQPSPPLSSALRASSSTGSSRSSSASSGSSSPRTSSRNRSASSSSVKTRAAPDYRRRTRRTASVRPPGRRPSLLTRSTASFRPSRPARPCRARRPSRRRGSR
jgi:hypothetical protein